MPAHGWLGDDSRSAPGQTSQFRSSASPRPRYRSQPVPCSRVVLWSTRRARAQVTGMLRTRWRPRRAKGAPPGAFSFAGQHTIMDIPFPPSPSRHGTGSCQSLPGREHPGRSVLRSPAMMDDRCGVRATSASAGIRCHHGGPWTRQAKGASWTILNGLPVSTGAWKATGPVSWTAPVRCVESGSGRPGRTATSTHACMASATRLGQIMTGMITRIGAAAAGNADERRMVEPRRIELPTFALRTRRSPS